MLKESLGGNAKTTMIATISPSHQHFSETLSTLRYAQQTRSIINKAKVNEDPKSKLIRGNVTMQQCLLQIRYRSLTYCASRLGSFLQFNTKMYNVNAGYARWKPRFIKTISNAARICQMTKSSFSPLNGFNRWYIYYKRFLLLFFLYSEMLAEIQRLKHSQRRTGDFSNALEKEVKLLRQKLQETQGELTSSARSIMILILNHIYY